MKAGLIPPPLSGGFNAKKGKGVKITIYSIITDDDNGTDAELFLSETECDERYREIVEAAWDHSFPNKPFPDDATAAYEMLFDQPCYLDTIDTDVHEIDIPISSTLVITLQEKHGIWGEIKSFPREDWKTEVANGDTNLGYWEWSANKLEEIENLK